MTSENSFDEIGLQAVSTDGYGGITTNNTDIDAQDLKEQKRDRYRQNTRYRKHLAIWVMLIVPLWLIAILVIVYLCAASVFFLSNEVMVALLVTTTANVLGLAFIVLKGLFNVKD